MLASLFFAFVAGGLSILSPCVLPLLPVVLGSASAKGRAGPLLLAAGLVISFVVIGLFVSLIGFSIGLDGRFFRAVSAVMLLAAGLLLAMPYLQRRFALAAGPVGNWIDKRVGSGAGLGQFGLGLLLGAVWSPCVGPTLGAASVLAAQGQNLAQVAATMLTFGFGVAVPLVVLGLAQREMMLAWRGRLLSTSTALKSILGLLLLASGILILTGQDKQLEAVLVNVSPDWLTALTTRF